MPKKGYSPTSMKKSKAGDLAAMSQPLRPQKGLPHGKAQQATFQPQKDEERSRPVGRKGMMKGY